jgi:hypothetical protein
MEERDNRSLYYLSLYGPLQAMYVPGVQMSYHIVQHSVHKSGLPP